MKEIFMPNGNEKDLISMANCLGIKDIVLFYDKKIPSETNGVKIAKKFGLKGKSDLVFVKSSDKDRSLIESRSVNLIYDFELRGRKEFMNIRNSGMNQVIAKLMHEKKVSYGINFSSILNLSDLDKSKVIGRIKQNLVLCKKYGVEIVIGSFASEPYSIRNPKDLDAFLKILN